MKQKGANNKRKKLKPAVIDLFSGCGGLSVGFKDAGFDILLGVDNWDDCLKTFEYNHPRAKILCRDIHALTSKKIRKKINGREIDVVVGGPPCQGFSMAGTRKENDKRNELVYDFIRLVEELKPKFFLMENVAGILSMKRNDHYVRDVIIDKFKKVGYKNVEYKIIHAHHYGVPQTRKRAFFFGNNIDVPVAFPRQTHFSPNGFLFGNRPYVTVGEAINDLPTDDFDDGLEERDYISQPKSEYQKYMRQYSKKIYNHVVSNHSKQTRKVIKLVPEGGSWRDLPKKYQNIRSYSNTWKRLDSKKPSVTIDTGHRHHFHYKANRVPTVRESARIQSFRDDFIFLGSKTSQFKQVGNAVPPLLARAFAEKIKKSLDDLKTA